MMRGILKWAEGSRQGQVSLVSDANSDSPVDSMLIGAAEVGPKDLTIGNSSQDPIEYRVPLPDGFTSTST
jgi:hypothetical protein